MSSTFALCYPHAQRINIERHGLRHKRAQSALYAYNLSDVSFWDDWLIRRPKQQDPRIRERDKLLTASSVRACRILQDSWVMPDTNARVGDVPNFTTASAIGLGVCFATKRLQKPFRPCAPAKQNCTDVDLQTSRARRHSFAGAEVTMIRITGRCFPGQCLQQENHTGEFGVTSEDTAIATIETSVKDGVLRLA